MKVGSFVQYCSSLSRQFAQVWHESTMTPTAQNSPTEKAVTPGPTFVRARQGRRASAQGFVQQPECDDVPSLSAILGRQTAAQVTGLCHQRDHGIRNALLPIPLLGTRFDIQSRKFSELPLPGLLLVGQQMPHDRRATIGGAVRSSAGRTQSWR